jgi:hypothetical protein
LTLAALILSCIDRLWEIRHLQFIGVNRGNLVYVDWTLLGDTSTDFMRELYCRLNIGTPRLGDVPEYHLAPSKFASFPASLLVLGLIAWIVMREVQRREKVPGNEL